MDTICLKEVTMNGTSKNQSDTAGTGVPMRKFEPRYVVNKVKSELSGYEKIRRYLEERHGADIDPQTLLDTLEGETELHEALVATAEVIQENNAQLEGLNRFKEDLESRRNRIAATNETLRNIITMAMDRAGIQSVRGPLFTLSTRYVKPGLIIDDESTIPSDFFVAQDPKLDTKTLKAALEEGKAIEGAHLGNGGISLTIRVK